MKLRAIIQPAEVRNVKSITQWSNDGFIPLRYYWAWDVYDDDDKAARILDSPVASGLSLGRRAAVRAARRRVRQAIALTKRIESGDGEIEVRL